MTTSTLPSRYRINGLIDTNRPAFENIEKIANACGTFLTYDIHQGLWSIVINQAGSSVKSFNDSNIIGPINISGTGLDQLYNSVRVEFPLRDTADGTDYVVIEIPAGDRFPNEPDNELQITLEMCNEPVQAEIIGLIELKQSRIDEIITFTTDYSVINLNAGDLIDVSNTQYQFTNRVYRIISLSEVDADDGSILIEVTALKYDANVYDFSDLGRYIRTDRNGIKTIGALGTPATPTINPYTKVSRPRLAVEAVVPSGIVESMELWISTDNVTFKLQDTQYQPGGGNLTTGATVVFDYDQVASSNYYVKVRAMNSTTTGPFSAVASYIAYVPVQTTDAIGSNTVISDPSGNAYLTGLAVSLLLKKFADFFGSDPNDTVAGLVVDEVSAAGFPTLDVFAQDYGAVNTIAKLNAMAAGYSTNTGYVIANVTANPIVQTYTLSTNYRLCKLLIQTPNVTCDYEYQDRTGTQQTASGFILQPAMALDITDTNGNLISSTIDWQTNAASFVLTNQVPGTITITAYIIQTYDLDMTWPRSFPAGGQGEHSIFFINFSGSQGFKSSLEVYT